MEWRARSALTYRPSVKEVCQLTNLAVFLQENGEPEDLNETTCYHCRTQVLTKQGNTTSQIRVNPPVQFTHFESGNINIHCKIWSGHNSIIKCWTWAKYQWDHRVLTTDRERRLHQSQSATVFNRQSNTKNTDTESQKNDICPDYQCRKHYTSIFFFARDITTKAPMHVEITRIRSPLLTKIVAFRLQTLKAVARLQNPLWHPESWPVSQQGS